MVCAFFNLSIERWLRILKIFFNPTFAEIWKVENQNANSDIPLIFFVFSPYKL